MGKTLAGIRKMGGLPGLIFIIDVKNEHTAVKEARKLDIPSVAIIDTNCDPDEVTYAIPGNDDAIRSIKLITHLMAEATIEGRAIVEKKDEGEEEVGEEVEEGAVVREGENSAEAKQEEVN